MARLHVGPKCEHLPTLQGATTMPSFGPTERGERRKANFLRKEGFFGALGPFGYPTKANADVRFGPASSAVMC